MKKLIQKGIDTNSWMKKLIEFYEEEVGSTSDSDASSRSDRSSEGSDSASMSDESSSESASDASESEESSDEIASVKASSKPSSVSIAADIPDEALKMSETQIQTKQSDAMNASFKSQHQPVIVQQPIKADQQPKKVVKKEPNNLNEIKQKAVAEEEERKQRLEKQ